MKHRRTQTHQSTRHVPWETRETCTRVRMLLVRLSRARACPNCLAAWACGRRWKHLDAWLSRGAHLNASNVLALVGGAGAPKDGGLQLRLPVATSVCCRRWIYCQGAGEHLPQGAPPMGLAQAVSASAATTSMPRR